MVFSNTLGKLCQMNCFFTVLDIFTFMSPVWDYKRTFFPFQNAQTRGQQSPRLWMLEVICLFEWSSHITLQKLPSPVSPQKIFVCAQWHFYHVNSVSDTSLWSQQTHMQPISFFILATHLMHTLGEFPWGIPEDSQFTDDLEFIISFRKFRFYYLKEKKKRWRRTKTFPMDLNI